MIQENDLPSKEEVQKFCHPGGSADTNLQCNDTGNDLSPNLVSHSVVEDSMVIGPISSSDEVMEEETQSVLRDAMAKANTRAEVAALYSLVLPISARPVAGQVL